MSYRLQLRERNRQYSAYHDGGIINKLPHERKTGVGVVVVVVGDLFGAHALFRQTEKRWVTQEESR